MRLLKITAIFAIICAPPAWAQAPYDDPKTPTGWAWSKIRNDDIADFNQRCGKLDPNAKTGWDDPCRQIPPQFLVDVLTVPKWRDQLPRHRVRLSGMRVTGTIDLTDAEITPEVWIHASRIDGHLILNDSHWTRLLSLQGSVLGGAFSAYRMRSESDILLRNHAAISGNVDVAGAMVRGDVDMSSSSFDGALNASSLTVGGDLVIRDHASVAGEVNLVGAKIGGSVDISGSSVTKSVKASRLQIGGSLFLNGGAKFGGEVSLVGARVGSIVTMDSSSFTGPVIADSLTVAGNLFIRDHAAFGAGVDLIGSNIGSDLDLSGHSSFGGEVRLIGTKVGGIVDMDGSSFAKTVNANRLNVSGSLFMRDRAAFTGDVVLIGARIGGNLEMSTSAFTGAMAADSLKVERNLVMSNQAKFSGLIYLVGAQVGGNLQLWNATAMRIDLSGAEVRELLLSGLGWWCAGGTRPSGNATISSAGSGKIVPAHWRLDDPAWLDAQCESKDPAKLPALILRNAHVDDFQDSADAWPPLLDLEGFRYDRLGGLGGEGRNDMRQRSPKEWIDWLARDRAFSTQPYMELSSVLAAAGHRDTADAILLAGRERERGEAWREGRYASWTWLTFLSYVAGYGIGLYTFLVLLWVLGLTVLGADVLWYSERARRRGLLWRLGASLHRLLPVIELSKEFTDFFDNPPPQPGEAPNLDRLQVAYFAGHAIAGWVLGFFLLAAMGGIIQKS